MPADETTPRYQPHGHPGLFIALEGPDGGGKTTQAGRLAGWLRGQGFDVVACRDPGSTALGDRLRRLVLDRDAVPMVMEAEMLVYMAARAQLVAEVIQPSLAAGRVVVSDRFLLSNIVYQGVAGGLSVDDLWQVGRIATAGVLPDLTLVLDVAPETARRRKGPASDRIEERPDAYRRLVRDGFLQAVGVPLSRTQGCAFYPAPMVLIEPTDRLEAAFERIQKEVELVLALGPRA
jgi:dTMP kinase